jgi:histone deacetylase 1/2
MEQPQGFVDSSQSDSVCHLHKSLYGLKQAPRAWFQRLSQVLLDLGFMGSTVDTSLFVFLQEAMRIYVLIYVDDIIVTSNKPTAVSDLITKLQHEFSMKDLGPLSYFLGIQVHRNREGLHLHQSKYIVDLLNRANMTGAKPYQSPCISGKKLSKFDSDPLLDSSLYRHIVGALQYCTLTRPDIAFSVNQLCQFLHAPTTTHFTATKRVLRYLKSTVEHGIYFSKGFLQLHGYCDSDWAGSPDDRRSTTNYGIFLGPCLISWAAKKQPVVARSSTEAEYRSMAITTAELYWIRMLFKDLHIPRTASPTLWVDNI